MWFPSLNKESIRNSIFCDFVKTQQTVHLYQIVIRSVSNVLPALSQHHTKFGKGDLTFGTVVQHHTGGFVQLVARVLHFRIVVHAIVRFVAAQLAIRVEADFAWR